jgi:hypothetical protein
MVIWWLRLFGKLAEIIIWSDGGTEFHPNEQSAFEGRNTLKSLATETQRTQRINWGYFSFLRALCASVADNELRSKGGAKRHQRLKSFGSG